jgi:hypothetical protein
MFKNKTISKNVLQNGATRVTKTCFLPLGCFSFRFLVVLQEKNSVKAKLRIRPDASHSK